MNSELLTTGARVWLMETLVSGFNFYVLMNLVYEPRWGELAAHQIGMATRIVYIFIFSFLLLRYVRRFSTLDLFMVGFMWLGLELSFEWLGSILFGRTVQEILIGWNVAQGYMWPYVLAAYFFSTPIVGTFIRKIEDSGQPHIGQ